MATHKTGRPQRFPKTSVTGSLHNRPSCLTKAAPPHLLFGGKSLLHCACSQTALYLFLEKQTVLFLTDPGEIPGEEELSGKQAQRDIYELHLLLSEFYITCQIHFPQVFADEDAMGSLAAEQIGEEYSLETLKAAVLHRHAV